MVMMVLNWVNGIHQTEWCCIHRSHSFATERQSGRKNKLFED